MALSLQVCLLAACTNEMTESPVNPGDGYLELNFTTIETRTELNQSGAGNFSQGDKIGLFIGNGATYEYRELTYTSGTWEPRLRRSDFGDGTLTLAAHYPALTDQYGQAEKAPFTLAEDQTANGFAASDLLTAQKSLPAGDNRADMTFTHALHRLRVEITGESVSEVKFRSRMKGEVNLLTGAVTAEEDSFGWISPRKNTDGSYEAVILPQTAAALRDAEGLLKITTAKGERIYKAPANVNGKALDEFLAGQQLTLKIALKESDVPISPDLANQTLWVYGVKGVEFPGEKNLPSYDIAFDIGKIPAGNWFRHDYDDFEIEDLTWQEGCGWYDCNKSYNYLEGDGSLCWAASASNLLLWWMTMNKEYIAAYDAEYYGSGTPKVTSSETGKIFERPAPEFKLFADSKASNRSPVFQFFKSLFSKSGWNTSGVDWFINGDIGNNQTNNDMWGFPGFFYEVFKQTDIISEDSSRFPNGNAFNAFVTQTLLNHKGLGFTVTGYNGDTIGNHAMTAWGVEYDEAGIISHIYICDNNSGDQDANGAVIRRYQIVYDDDMSKGQTYLQPLHKPTAKMPIMCLGAVDLRRDIWAQKYPSVIPAM